MTVRKAQPGATPPGSAETADQAAPLDALLADAALGTFRRVVPDALAVKFAAALARRPYTSGRRLDSLAAELVAVDPFPHLRNELYDQSCNRSSVMTIILSRAGLAMVVRYTW